MNWTLDSIGESIEPEVDAERMVRGLRQIHRGMRGGEAVVTLDLTVATDVAYPRDVIRIDSVPPLEMAIDGGIHGDFATWSIVVNAIPAVLTRLRDSASPRALPPGVISTAWT